MTNPIDLTVEARGQSRSETARPRLVPTPLLSALREAGTQHVYGDTADIEELGRLVRLDEDAIRAEVDGNTANQPLVARVVERYLDADDPTPWARELSDQQPGLSHSSLLVLLYTILLGRIGNDMTRRFGAGRSWEASLQLHMALGENAEAARSIGRLLRKTVPTAFIKVPFTPDAPHCLLVARDLERAGVPVNLTSTFSARQAVTGALLADVTRTNIFMGRLNQGLQASLLGEHVDLAAQRALLELRRSDGVKTRLIVASVHDWQTFVRVAGCDAFTAPCDVIQAFLAQDETAPSEIESRLETSYEDELGIDGEVFDALGPDAIARLYRVETELVEFLRELRASPAVTRLDDGEALYKRFDQAGFGDLFHTPTGAERGELDAGKLPRLDGALIDRVPLDTHFSLLANADFARHQRTIDGIFERRLDAGAAGAEARETGEGTAQGTAPQTL